MVHTQTTTTSPPVCQPASACPTESHSNSHSNPNPNSKDEPQQLSHSGRWIPLPKIVYASVIFPFSPVQLDQNSFHSNFQHPAPHQLHDPDHDHEHDLINPNPHQVPLEVGDECYVFEQYLPAQLPLDPTAIWYRGYVVNISNQPSALASMPPPSPQVLLQTNLPPDQAASPAQLFHPPCSSVPDEPQVFLGIFPASHLQIREHLDDSSHRSSSCFAQILAASAVHFPSALPFTPAVNALRSFPKDSGPMDPLPEEDESDLITSPLKALQFDPPQFDLDPDHKPQKFPTPLPSLKPGDETISGRDEPLIDEIACALREWYSLLYIHLHRRHYRLFHLVKDQIEALHMGRRQLLAQTLSTEEAAKLRCDLVNRLVYANYIQGLDIIVRHPDYGALVDCEVDMSAVDSRSWMSIIRMYVCQVKLAYVSQALHAPSLGPASVPLSDPALSNALNPVSGNHHSRLAEPNQIPLNAHLPSLRTTRSKLTSQPDLHGSPRTTAAGPGGRPKFYHIMLELKSFQAVPCAEGELVELYFSLYNKSDARFLTEEFCVILNHLGQPHHPRLRPPNQLGYGDCGEGGGEKVGSRLMLRTMFKDISQHDVQDSIFLVCRLAKNGVMKSTGVAAGNAMAVSAPSMQETFSQPARYEAETRSPVNSFDGPPSAGVCAEPTGPQQYALPDAHGEYCGMTFMLPRTGMQSVRRPYGCAAVELSMVPGHASQLGLGQAALARPFAQLGLAPHGVLETPTAQYSMNIFSPVNEASFPTLHEDIIASRVKEFFGSGSLTPNGGAGGGGTMNGKHAGPGGSRNEAIGIELRTYYGDTATILKENPSLLSEVPLTSRLGFPDVVYPDDSRNEIYVKLWSGDFSHLNAGGAPKMISSAGSGKNIEVAVELRTKNGQTLERVISRGSGEAKVTRYNSMVYRNNQTPTWGELLKLDISSELIEECHLFFTFRNRQEKPSRNNSNSGGAVAQLDRPFGFGYLPLFSANRTFIADGEHNLVLFKYEKQSATPEVYSRTRPVLEPGQTTADIPPALAKLLIPLRDSFVVRSFLCSTRYTQNEVLLKLIKWEELLEDPAGLREALTKLKFASEVEICKFLRNIFDALFGVLVSAANAETKEYNELLFNALVTLLGIVSDRRFTNFKPVVELYIEHHFSTTTAAGHLLESFQNLLLNPTAPEKAHSLRCTIKVWGYLLRFIVRSRELQRLKDSNATAGGVMSDTIEAKFKHDLAGLLGRINNIMTMDSSAILGTQTLAVQHFASLLPELGKVFSPAELLEKANSFCEAIVATKGKIVMWKLLLQEHIVMSTIFEQPEGRVQLVPKLVGWVKPHLGSFEDYAMCKPNDSEAARHSARVTWLEGIRIATAVVAVALDRLHEALVDPAISGDARALAQEQDNIDYLLGLLPKLLDSFQELDEPANVELIQRLGTTASVISPVPVVFPASYPFSLLNSVPSKPWIGSQAGTNQTTNQPPSTTPSFANMNGPPTLQNCLGEVSIVMITLILLTPTSTLTNFLEMMLEVEGKSNFGNFLNKLYQSFYGILKKNKAWPEKWLNVNVLGFKAGLKVVEVCGKIMEKEFVPKLVSSRSRKEGGDVEGRRRKRSEKRERRDSEEDHVRRIGDSGFVNGIRSRSEHHSRTYSTSSSSSIPVQSSSPNTHNTASTRSRSSSSSTRSRSRSLIDEKFDGSLWSNFFLFIHGLISSPQLVIEEFGPQKRRAVWKLGGDVRGVGGKVFREAWEAIGDKSGVVGGGRRGRIGGGKADVGDGGIGGQGEDNGERDGDGREEVVVKYGGYQVQFVPGFIEPLVELCLSHHDEMRSNAVLVLFSVIVSEYNLNQDFTVISDEMIDKLDQILGTTQATITSSSTNSNSYSTYNNSTIDESNKSNFVEQLRRLFDESDESVVCQELKLKVFRFLNELNGFLDLVFCIRNLPVGDEFVDDRVIGTLKLMSFIRNIGRSGIYIHYVHKLVNFHEAYGNYVEAGLALKLHADLHEWDLSTVVEAVPELSLVKQTAFARKETLYFRILDYLSKGKAWESGIEICKELQEQYENVSFDYERLSEVLAHQSSLYLNIVKTDRYFSDYFRVAFYGQGFPPSVQNRQFVYRGYEWEKYAAFCDRMHNKHPNAEIIQSMTVSTEELQFAEGQYLHITKVVAEPDRSMVVFTNLEVSSSVRSYYEHNATNTFSFSKLFNKDNVSPAENVYMWVEKTFLVCEDAFPTVLKRSEILEIRVLEISPIENAIMVTEQKTRELESLHRRYMALNKTSGAKLNTNPLSMALNSAVDAPTNSGVGAFRNAFLTAAYLDQHPDQYQSIQMLQQAIDHQTAVIDSSLRLHQALCLPEMKAFHATLQKFFAKNFAEEIARLPADTSVLSLDHLTSEEGEQDATWRPGMNGNDTPQLSLEGVLTRQGSVGGMMGARAGAGGSSMSRMQTSSALSASSIGGMSPTMANESQYLYHQQQQQQYQYQYAIQYQDGLGRGIPGGIGASPSGRSQVFNQASPPASASVSRKDSVGGGTPLSRTLSPMNGPGSGSGGMVSMGSMDRHEQLRLSSTLNGTSEYGYAGTVEEGQGGFVDATLRRNGSMARRRGSMNVGGGFGTPGGSESGAKEVVTSGGGTIGKKSGGSAGADRKSILGLKFGSRRK